MPLFPKSLILSAFAATAGLVFSACIIGVRDGNSPPRSCDELGGGIWCEEYWFGTLSQSCPDDSGFVETSFRFDRQSIPDDLRSYHGSLGAVRVDSIREGDWLFDSNRACNQNGCNGEAVSIHVRRVHPDDIWGLIRHANPAGAPIDSGPIILSKAVSASCL